MSIDNTANSQRPSGQQAKPAHALFTGYLWPNFLHTSSGKNKQRAKNSRKINPCIGPMFM